MTHYELSPDHPKAHRAVELAGSLITASMLRLEQEGMDIQTSALLVSEAMNEILADPELLAYYLAATSWMNYKLLLRLTAIEATVAGISPDYEQCVSNFLLDVQRSGETLGPRQGS